MKSAAAQPLPPKKAAQDGVRDIYVDFLSGPNTQTQVASEAWRTIAPELPGILDRFYKDLTDYPELSAKLGDGGSKVENLKKAQTKHWEFILNNETDLEFEGHCIRVGEAHVRTDLSVQWYVSSYGSILQQVIPLVISKNKLHPGRASKQLQALIGRFFIDIVTSIGAFNGTVQRVAEEKLKEETSLRNLKNLAKTLQDINSISMDMAVLARNTHTASESGQAISAAVSELVASTEQISDNSDSTSQNANHATKSVTEGMEAMGTVLDAMNDIAQTSKQTENSLTGLMEASHQIGEFLSVIESISNQTNLLALNATIEAARAGEAGKGFAVVAAEVKELASLSNKAAEDISTRIHSLNQGMTSIQSSISGSLDAIEKGQDRILGANQMMEQLRGQVTEVSGSMHEVSTILQQQTKASHEIAGSVTGVADLTSENERTLQGMVKAMQESNDQFSRSATDWFEGSSNRSLCEMAKIDHVLFKKHVLDAVMGRNEWQSGDVPDHHDCRLGKWYEGIGNSSISSNAIFKSLLAPHDRVHSSAKKALALYEKGNLSEAFTALREMDDASHEVLSILDELSDALGNELKDADKRSFVRAKVQDRAFIITDKEQFEVDVTDMSKIGLGVSGLPKDLKASTVRVKIGTEVRTAQVVWNDGQQAGLRYAK
ncbi:hypothetical protein FDK21_11530 [Cohaesibacter sp. CAU 1516]|uniref:methyl-accepting chemotaxis protein n=1 Tax=Cohaesibacter sp. CAU 1516 TaxID=2576038 RepID=UPI0010FCED88|nr:methyl-accepting chemotaxis protein [Cohaesibacter sp. CAU 1516]TLP46228.1 hypothetical protein FDK21_11530 [Cohaesibacter sp. CAU 1516]